MINSYSFLCDEYSCVLLLNETLQQQQQQQQQQLLELITPLCNPLASCAACLAGQAPSHSAGPLGHPPVIPIYVNTLPSIY